MASRRKFSDEYKREAVRMATQPRVTRGYVDLLAAQTGPLNWPSATVVALSVLLIDELDLADPPALVEVRL